MKEVSLEISLSHSPCSLVFPFCAVGFCRLLNARFFVLSHPHVTVGVARSSSMISAVAKLRLLALHDPTFLRLFLPAIFAVT